MSETHSIISRLYESSVKDLYEPIDPKKSFVEKSDDMISVLSLFSTTDHVWVVDNSKDKHVVGVITESDTIQLFAPPYTPLQSYDKPSIQSLQYGLSMTAEDIMSKQPLTVRTNGKIIKVIETMKEQHIKQLAVVDEQDHLIGEITLSRLIKEYSKRSSEIQK